MYAIFQICSLIFHVFMQCILTQALPIEEENCQVNFPNHYMKEKTALPFLYIIDIKKRLVESIWISKYSKYMQVLQSTFNCSLIVIYLVFQE